MKNWNRINEVANYSSLISEDEIKIGDKIWVPMAKGWKHMGSSGVVYDIKTENGEKYVYYKDSSGGTKKAPLQYAEKA